MGKRIIEIAYTLSTDKEAGTKQVQSYKREIDGWDTETPMEGQALADAIVGQTLREQAVTRTLADQKHGKKTVTSKSTKVSDAEFI